MAYIFQTRTDGLGHPRNVAVLKSAQNQYEQPPAYAGDDDTPTLDTATDAVCEVIGRACRATDKAARVDLLKEAASMLDQLAEEVESGEVSQ